MVRFATTVYYLITCYHKKIQNEAAILVPVSLYSIRICIELCNILQIVIKREQR